MDTVYPYVKANARERLAAARAVARETGMLKRPIVSLGGLTWRFFPWLGTRSFRTLRRYIAKNAPKYKLSALEFEGLLFLKFRMEGGAGDKLFTDICADFARGVDTEELVGPNETPAFDKCDEYVPSELFATSVCKGALAHG